jgi:MFS family permease
MKRTKGKEWISLAIAALAAFCVYSCMFAFRKPFTVARYDTANFLGIEYKIWLVIAQTLGYTLSKFFGIRYIAELSPAKRAAAILLYMAGAWTALLFFALVPPPYNIVFLLLNGFPLGIIYGLVFSYLEGRRSTEVLGAVLATSFIFASGFTQSVGKYLLQLGVDTWWMPFITGGLFAVPLIIFTFVLKRTPPPAESDIRHRTIRRPMNGDERRGFVQTFGPGLMVLILAYIMLTVIREYRSNFAANIWTDLGAGQDPSVFTRTEIPSSLVTLLLMSLLVLVKSNIRAFMLNHLIIMAGFILCIGATMLFRQGHLSPFWWLTLTGLGMYMGYVPFNCMLFDRLIASFRYVSNAGFVIYLADSFGYLGSDAVLIVKNFMDLKISWSRFFETLVIWLSGPGFLLVGVSALYFRYKYHQLVISKGSGARTSPALQGST